MENISEKKIKKVTSKNKPITEENNPVDLNRNVWGWENSMSCAESIWGSIHGKLLEGDLVFAYKNTGNNSDIHQFVVVKNNYTGNINDFGVGVISTGYTMLLPHVPVDYVEVELVEDLKKWKLDKTILNTYEQIIKGIKNEITSN